MKLNYAAFACSITAAGVLAVGCGPANNLSEEEAWRLAHLNYQSSERNAEGQTSNIISNALFGFGLQQVECEYGGTVDVGISFDDVFGGSSNLFSIDLNLNDCSNDNEIWQTGGYAFSLGVLEQSATVNEFEYVLSGALSVRGDIEGSYDFNYTLRLRTESDPSVPSFSFSANYEGTISGHDLESLSESFTWEFTAEST